MTSLTFSGSRVWLAPRATGGPDLQDEVEGILRLVDDRAIVDHAGAVDDDVDFTNSLTDILDHGAERRRVADVARVIFHARSGRADLSNGAADLPRLENALNFGLNHLRGRTESSLFDESPPELERGLGISSIRVFRAGGKR